MHALKLRLSCCYVTPRATPFAQTHPAKGQEDRHLHEGIFTAKSPRAGDGAFPCLGKRRSGMRSTSIWNTIVTSGIIRARGMSYSCLRQRQTTGVQARFTVETSLVDF